MRKLAAFTVSFALGICLAQYLLPERLLLPVAAFSCRGLPRPAAAGTLAEAGVAGGHGAGPGPGVELAVQLCCTGASCGPVRQRGHRFHDSFGVRRPHGLRRQGDSEAGGGSPGQGGLLRRGGPAGPGAGPDGGGTGEISGFRPASGRIPLPTSPLRECSCWPYQRGDEAVYGEGSAGSPRWWPAMRPGPCRTG